MAFLEDILGIDHGDGEPPCLEARAALCKEVVVELKNAASSLQAQEDKNPDGGGEPEGSADKGDGEDDENKDPSQPQNSPQNAQEGTQGNADTTPDAPADQPDMICPVCGKKCGSKSVLTRHMRETHGAEYQTLAVKLGEMFANTPVSARGV